LILIGSRSAKLRMGDAFARPCVDFDFVCTREEYEQWIKINKDKVGPAEIYPEMNGDKMIVKGTGSICEFEFIKPGSSNELLLDLVKNDKETIETKFGKIPSLPTLFAIKNSHRFKKFSDSKGFWKTAIDWHTMKHFGAVIKEEHKEFCKLREKESYAAQKHPSLMQSKENFFKDDGINYEIDHDSLHEAMKHLEMPAYKYYARDNEPVFSDKDKFFACSPEIRLYGAIEEISVLAIERSVHAHPGVWPYDYAWRYACAKLASTISSGWFRSWIYDHIPEILKAYPINYVEKFKKGIETGTIRYINKDEHRQTIA
jgi:hypothetical protein